jgi:hypothetical protein
VLGNDPDVLIPAFVPEKPTGFPGLVASMFMVLGNIQELCVYAAPGKGVLHNQSIKAYGNQ